MIFGFNTDVQGRDAIYHVQTEDRGQRNPVIESTIYLGGKIVGKRRSAYDPATSNKEQIEEAVRHQHKELMEAIRSGTRIAEIAGVSVAAGVGGLARSTSAPASGLAGHAGNMRPAPPAGGPASSSAAALEPAASTPAAPTAQGYSIELSNPATLGQGEYFRFQLVLRSRDGNAPAGELALDVRWLVDGHIADQQTLSSRADGRADVWVSSPKDSQSSALVIRAQGPQGRQFAKFEIQPSA